jgi:hypothetical protein
MPPELIFCRNLIEWAPVVQREGVLVYFKATGFTMSKKAEPLSTAGD